MSEKKVFIDGPAPMGDPEKFVQTINNWMAGVGQVVADDLPADDKLRIHCEAQVNYYTHGVAFLRNSFPNENIRRHAHEVWCICNNQIVRCLMMPHNPVRSLSFMYAAKKDGTADAGIAVPFDYVEKMKKDAVLHMGGIVFVGSQVRDYYNGVFDKYLQDSAVAEQIGSRAKMWEAEYLLTMQRIAPEHPFDEYQRDLMQRFPKGIETQPELLYKTNPVPQEKT